MSLALREGSEEARRKERIFAIRRVEEEKAYKEYHYQKLITENLQLKEVLKLAKQDIEDWIYCKGESPQSTEVLKAIADFV